ncbi:MAG: lipid II flippase MurJ, partial [Hyphomicrobiaceae bacterium]
MDRVWLKSGVALAAAILLGRLAGLFRELLIAHYYGADRTTDQLILFLTIPDVFTNMLAGGAMLYVLVPEFARQTPEGRRILFRRASGYGLAGFGCLAILVGLIFTDRLLELIAPGFTPLERRDMQAYVAIFALMIPLTGVASITTSFLHARGSFALASMGTVIVNLCIIAGLILSTTGTGNKFAIVGLALLAGGLLRYGSQVLALRKVLSGSSAGAPQPQISDGLARQYAKALLGGGLFLLLPVSARALASDNAGEIAILNYTMKLAELPLGVAVGIIPFLLLPRMALAHAAGERDQARTLNRNSLYANMSLSLAIGLPAAWFSSTLVDLLFGWGNLSSAKLAIIASLATITLATMPFQGILGHFMAALNASRQAGATVIVSM